MVPFHQDGGTRPVKGGDMGRLKRFAIPLASLIALVIGAGASWRL